MTATRPIRKIAEIDNMESEEEAVFSDEGDVSFSDDGDDVQDENITEDASKTGSNVPVASHLAFLAGAIDSYPASGIAAPGQGDDDEEDEYVPGDSDAAKFGPDVPTEHTVVNITQLYDGLSVAAKDASEKSQAVKDKAAAIDEEEAEFSDEEASSSDMDDDSEESVDALKYLDKADTSMDDDDEEDGDYVP